jgi:hypothetical protein
MTAERGQADVAGLQRPSVIIQFDPIPLAENHR